MVRLLLWVFIVQLLLNPFTVFVIVGCLLPETATGVLGALTISSIWYIIWFRVRKAFTNIDRQAMEFWVK